MFPLSAPESLQRRSHLFLVGAAEIERRRREAILILGGLRASPPPPPGNFLNKRCDFVQFGMISGSNFVSFWRHFVVCYPLIWQENVVMERRKLCDGTDMLPYILSWTASFVFCVCFFVFFLYVCGGVVHVGVRFK